MKLCRFHVPDQGARLGRIVNATIYDLTASGRSHLATLTALLKASVQAPLRELADILLPDLPAYPYAELDRPPAPDQPHLLPPVDRQEVWAAGVTYAWSRAARVREAVTKDIYTRVYEAARPELFFKSLPEKVVGPNDWIGIRGDSHWNVPEPELTLVLNPHLQIVGYTIGNDVSSRDIEGENPLYLPQAKIFRHSCALGPAILVAGTDVDARNLPIRLTITRHGVPAFQGETNSSEIHRSLDEMLEYLGMYYDFPNGAMLLTGTGIVPPDSFTLQNGDQVVIEIEGLGILRNTVRQM